MIALEEVKQAILNDGRLIRLPLKGKAVFVGDTHGDFDATKTVFDTYFTPGCIMVFLGDYIDRGPESRENIEFLLRKKIEAPKQIYLLAGNHEAYCSVPFHPAEFWESLSQGEIDYYSEICKILPFAAVTGNGLIAVHGVPPDLMDLKKAEDIELCSEAWFQLTWGDFSEEPGELLSRPDERPRYGVDYFTRVMKQLGANVCVRSHQPHISDVIFDKRCLTLMTSYAYTINRTIAVVDLEKPLITSIDNLDVLEI